MGFPSVETRERESLWRLVFIILPRFKFEVLTRAVIGPTISFYFLSKDHERYRGADIFLLRNTIYICKYNNTYCQCQVPEKSFTTKTGVWKQGSHYDDWCLLPVNLFLDLIFFKIRESAVNTKPTETSVLQQDPETI